MSAVRAVLAIAGKDLRIEARHRTALLTAGAFVVLVQLVFVFARDTGAVALGTLAPSVLWVTLALSSLLVLNRAFLLEREHAALEAILLAPVARGALFWGKWLANTILVLVVIAIAFPIWIVFFNVPPSAALLGVLGSAALAAAGFTAAGTLFAAITARTRYAELLLPVLLLPFLIPPVYAGAQVTVRFLGHRPFAELWPWLRILTLYDLVFLLLATLLFSSVVDE